MKQFLRTLHKRNWIESPLKNSSQKMVLIFGLFRLKVAIQISPFSVWPQNGKNFLIVFKTRQISKLIFISFLLRFKSFLEYFFLQKFSRLKVSFKHFFQTSGKCSQARQFMPNNEIQICSTIYYVKDESSRKSALNVCY